VYICSAYMYVVSQYVEGRRGCAALCSAVPGSAPLVMNCVIAYCGVVSCRFVKCSFVSVTEAKKKQQPRQYGVALFFCVFF